MPATFVQAAIDTVGPAAEAKGVRLEPVLDPAAGPVSGDPGRVGGDAEGDGERDEVALDGLDLSGDQRPGPGGSPSGWADGR